MYIWPAAKTRSLFLLISDIHGQKAIYIYIYTSVDPSLDSDESYVGTMQLWNCSKGWCEQQSIVNNFVKENCQINSPSKFANCLAKVDLIGHGISKVRSSWSELLTNVDLMGPC